jgi:hypothetical protein
LGFLIKISDEEKKLEKELLELSSLIQTSFNFKTYKQGDLLDRIFKKKAETPKKEDRDNRFLRDEEDDKIMSYLKEQTKTLYERTNSFHGRIKEYLSGNFEQYLSENFNEKGELLFIILEGIRNLFLGLKTKIQKYMSKDVPPATDSGTPTPVTGDVEELNNSIDQFYQSISEKIEPLKNIKKIETPDTRVKETIDSCIGFRDNITGILQEISKERESIIKISFNLKTYKQGGLSDLFRKKPQKTPSPTQPPDDPQSPAIEVDAANEIISNFKKEILAISNEADKIIEKIRNFVSQGKIEAGKVNGIYGLFISLKKTIQDYISKDASILYEKMIGEKKLKRASIDTMADSINKFLEVTGITMEQMAIICQSRKK